MVDRMERLRELVQAFLGEGPREKATPSVALSADLGELNGWLARLRPGAILDRWLTSRGPDRVAAVGQAVDVFAPIERVARLRARRRRVRVGRAVVLDEPLEADDDGIVMVVPPTAGCFEIQVELVDRDGGRVGHDAPQPALLQVIDDRPTHVVDVELVRSRPGDVVPALRALRARGEDVVYFDLAAEDRSVALHEALGAWGAPRAAVVVHPEAYAEVHPLGVDFRAVFVTVMLRRFLGVGISVASLVSERDVVIKAAARAQIEARSQPPGAPSTRGAPTAAGISAAGGAPSVVERLDRMTRTEAVAGNVCAVELDNRLARQQLFAAIEGGRRTIHLQHYMVRDGSFGDQLAARLCRAARRGVTVRLLVDALYSVDGVAGATNALARGMTAEPGVEVVSATPISTREDLEPRVLKQRDHRKMIVVDGEAAFVGGRNACDEYYTGFDEVAITDWTPHDRIPWFDAHVNVRGPLVGSIERAFVERWIAAGGRPPLGGVQAVVDPPARGLSRARLVLHEGIDDAATMLAYEALFDGARDHIWVVNDFPIVPSLQIALRRALARGVRVRVLTGSAVPRRYDGSFFEGPLHREAFEFMTKKRLEGLMRTGVEVWEYVAPPHPLIVCRGGMVRPYVHAKVVSVDGQVVSVGSANLDATASYWEREANVIVEDPGVARAVEIELSHVCRRGIRVDPRGNAWQRERLQRELASQLWPERLYS